MAASPTLQREASKLSPKARRGLLMAAGWAMTALGAVAIIAPHLSGLLIVVATGWLLWLAGALTLGTSLVFLSVRPFLPGIFSGLVAIAAGVALLADPHAGMLAVALLCAGAFVADAAFQLLLALKLKPMTAWRWILSSALASLLAALAIGLGAGSGAEGWFGAVVGVAILTTGLGFLAISRTLPKD